MRTNRRDEFEGYHSPPEEMTGLQPPRLLPHLVFVLVLLGGSLVAVHYFAGLKMFNRTLEALATPVGIVWLGLFFAAYWVLVWRIRLASLLCWITLLVLTLAGNSYVANQLITMAEAPYLQTDPFEMDKFDAILVLGGSTDTTPAGVPQLAMMGDRLVLAARLFHAGKVDKILVSGLRSGDLAEKELQLYEESARVLTDLNVPEANIVQLKLGSDTSEEIQGLKTWLADQQPQRTGILSSAWHLKRAMMLARRYEVDVTPIPANFLSESFQAGPGIVIPSAFNLYVTQLAVREFLAQRLDK